MKLICLAVSSKLGDVCIAGLRYDNKGWVRPVSSEEGGALSPARHNLYPGKRCPALLDVISIPVIRHQPKSHQPENWLIDEKTHWKNHGRVNDIPQLISWLESQLSQNSVLLNSISDRILYSQLESTSALESLLLIKPSSFQVLITPNFKGKKQFRGIFTLNNKHYNLVITDIPFKSKILYRELGTYSLKDLGFEKENIYLTISLSEPMGNGYCFKLIAAVILL